VRNDAFTCENCGAEVLPLTGGSCRNHCPQCLCSKHLDEVPGDRAVTCGGLMECVAVQHDARRGWMLVHRCLRCGALKRNRAALDDPVQPDSFEAILEAARRAARLPESGA
jgi:hypothetical protein